MEFKRTKLTVLVTAIIATGCSASKLESNTDQRGYCKNGGESSDYSCNSNAQAKTTKQQNTVTNPNTEAWMNSKLTDIKTWLKDIKENPNSAATKSSPSNTALLVQNPAATNPELVRIEALSVKGDNRSAMVAINTFLAQDPNNLEAELTKGLVLNNMGKALEAEALLRNAINRHPTSPELYNNLAIIYSDKGVYGKAIETLLLAFSTHPSYAQVNENLREVYASVASLAYNRALDLDSDKKLTPKLVVLRRTSAPSLPAVTTASLSTSIDSKNPTLAMPKTSITKVPASTQKVNTVIAQAALPKPSLSEKQQVLADFKAKSDKSETEVITAARRKVQLPLPALNDSEPETSIDIATLSLKQTPQPIDKTVTKSVVRVDNNASPKTGKAPGSSTLAAIKAVNRWSWTWTSQNVNAYLGSYVEDYTPKAGINNSQWRKQRTSRLTKPAFIKIQLSGIKSKRISNDVVEVTFLQKYQANNYNDQTNKRLTMKKIGDKWLISKEKNI